MPIGSDDGQYYEDGMEQRMHEAGMTPDPYTKARGITMRPIPDDHDNNVIDPDQTPGLGTRDRNEMRTPATKGGGGITPISNIEDQRDQGVFERLGDRLQYNLWDRPLTSTLAQVPSSPLGEQAGLSDIGKAKGINQPPAEVPDINAVQPSLAEDLFGKGEHDIRPALGQFYEQVKNAFKLPGDVYGGKIDPMSQQGIERAADLAGLMVMGPRPVAAKMADGTLGSFAGVGAKGADIKALREAQMMETPHMEYDSPDMASGKMVPAKTADEIWNATGWFKSADGRWKYEISPQNAKFREEAFSELESKTLEGKTKYSLAPNKQGFKLPDIINHPELFEAYPDLKYFNVEPVSGMLQLKGIKGYFDDVGNRIGIGHGTKDQLWSTLLHEIQHAIQHIEGFSTGGAKQLFETPRWQELAAEHTQLKANTEKKVYDHFEAENKKNPPKKDDEWDRSPFMQTVRMKDAIKNEDFLQGEWSNEKRWVNTGFSSEEQFKKGKEMLQKAKDIGVYDDLKKVIQGDKIKNEWDDLAYEHYRRIKGETEARNVQTRIDLDPTTRSVWSPLRSQDYPNAEQIWSPLDPASLKDLHP